MYLAGRVGSIHLLPAIEIGWGGLGFAIEFRWLMFVVTLYDHPFNHEEKGE